MSGTVDPKQNTLRDYLGRTGLFLEAVENLDLDGPVNPYYGINVSKTDKEPIDQVQGIIALKRIQEWNESNVGDKGKSIILIGGIYEVLNARTLKEVETIIQRNAQKEIKKKKLLDSIVKKLGLDVEILVTDDLWKDPDYWNILKNLIDKQVFTRGLLINDTMKFYETKDQLMATVKMKELPSDCVSLPLEFIKKIGNWPASLLYTPAEVTEALYLNRKYGVKTKVGQVQERVYDKYLQKQMTVIRLRQTVDLLSRKNKPQTVTPYIDKEKVKDSVRIFFEDSKELVAEKLEDIEVENYVFTCDDQYGEVLNPFVEKAIFAIELAQKSQDNNINMCRQKVMSGKDLTDKILKRKLEIGDVKQQLPELIESYILSLVGEV